MMSESKLFRILETAKESKSKKLSDAILLLNQETSLGRKRRPQMGGNTSRQNDHVAAQPSKLITPSTSEVHPLLVSPKPLPIVTFSQNSSPSAPTNSVCQSQKPRWDPLPLPVNPTKPSGTTQNGPLPIFHGDVSPHTASKDSSSGSSKMVSSQRANVSSAIPSVLPTPGTLFLNKTNDKQDFSTAQEHLQAIKLSKPEDTADIEHKTPGASPKSRFNINVFGYLAKSLQRLLQKVVTLFHGGIPRFSSGHSGRK